MAGNTTATEIKHIVVIGAGVVGLSTALRVQEKGYAVSILAETIPSDAKTIRYASHWAGAHHVSTPDAADPRKQKLEMETFRVMWDLSAPGANAEGCFLRLPQVDYYSDEQPGPEGYPNFRKLTPDELAAVPGARAGTTFTTLTIDTPVYLGHLLALFRARGGRVVRASVQHISQAASGAFGVWTRPPTLTSAHDGDGSISSTASTTSTSAAVGSTTSSSTSSRHRTPRPPPSAVLVCVGLGARTLGGLEDKNVYPIRGQTVLVRAPWVRFGRTLAGLGKDAVWTYIIPRRNGDVILGGTKIDDDWYPHPRASTTADILARCLALCPELDPAYAAARGLPTHVRSPVEQELAAKEHQDSVPKAAEFVDAGQVAVALPLPAGDSAGPARLSSAEATQALPAPRLAALRALIIEEGCGLRPARRGGIRLERGYVDVPVEDVGEPTLGAAANGHGSTEEPLAEALSKQVEPPRRLRRVPVVYNYGHGGYGFQSSWGSARAAVELLEEALSDPKSNTIPE